MSEGSVEPLERVVLPSPPERPGRRGAEIIHSMCYSGLNQIPKVATLCHKSPCSDDSGDKR